MVRDESVQMMQADVGVHVVQIECAVGGAICRDTDQARILPLACRRIDRAYVTGQFHIVEFRVGFEEVSHTKQGDLADYRSVQLGYLGFRTLLLAQRRGGSHVCVSVHRRDDPN